jgi:diaminopimelate epimerase
MRFTKMHGAGNDYVYVNAFTENIPVDVAQLAIDVSDRHKGIGSDGLILICPSERGDARMRMFNADGSESEMCGNGIRCVAKYVYDHGIATKPELKIETGRGVLSLQVEQSGGKVHSVRVNMGQPILDADQIPTYLPGNPPINVPLTALDKTFDVTAVSMGNPHCVTYVPELNDVWVLQVGPCVEKHEMFPRRVNAEFVQILSPTEIIMRVWERGSGETQACGTGACAVCVAGVLTGRTERKILAHLPGGDLHLEWSESTNEVFMTGPAVEVYEGVWNS